MNATFPELTSYQTDALFSKHFEEPYILTGYSYPGVNSYLKLMTNLTVPPPVYNRNLLLAGEYTSHAFYGYMEGALQSAYNITKEIFVQCS